MSLEIIASKTLFVREPLTYTAYQIRLPDQTVIEKDVIGHPGAVAIVPLLPDGTVVLIRQFRLAAAQTLYEIPAGTLEPGEEPRLCAERELQEEAGYYPGTLTALGGFFVAPGVSQEYIHLFVAQDLRPSRLNMDADEIIELAPMPLNAALDLISQGEIRDAKTIIGLLRVAFLHP